MPRRDLDIAKIYPGIQHGRYEGVPEHVWMRPGDPYSSLPCQMPQAPGGRMPVHPDAAAIQQDRPAVPVAHGSVDGPADRWWQRDQDHLAAFPADP